ncbi:MAG: Acetamidase/Formamidase [Anaerocolumna sp.]|nr:Acetamidase/Formamidase [Anaerocolumna sp.]
MLIIDRVNMIHYMSKDNAPAARCKSGDTVIFHTYDCFQNKLLPDNASIKADCPSLSNPATGPLYVEGALPGDTLKVEILNILVGPLGIGGSEPIGTFQNKMVEPIEYKIKRIQVEDGFAHIFDNLSVPIEPMIGVIGVAPLEMPIRTIIPGNHGGNMDCRQIKKGATLYLPVFVEGALLAMGDLHALMGDGEISECGLEIEGSVEVRISIIPKTGRIAPALCVDEKWITIASKESLDEAAKEATNMMADFLTSQVNLNPYDASLLLSLCGNLIVCQKCNSYKTMRMELSLDILNQLEQKPELI